ncbi:MAG: tetratricopeptide repeat protein [Chitinophagaceae bacterium]
MAVAQTKEQQAALDLEHAGKTDEAIVAFHAILKGSPTDGNVINELSALYYTKGDFASAYKMAGDALKQQPNNPAFMVSRARAALEVNKPEETLSLMDAAIAKDATLAYGQVLRGEALEAKNQPQQAIGAYSKALQANPQMVLAYNLRGTAFYGISRYEDALKDFDKFLEGGGVTPSVYNMRGMTQIRLGNRSAAIADYTKGLEVEPENYHMLANRGSAFLDAGNPALANADFEKAIILNGKLADGYYGLARVYNAEKAFAKALPMAEKAIALNGVMLPYRAVKCLALIGLDLNKEVIPLTDKMLSMDEKSSDAYIFKATAYSNLDDYANAISTLNTAIGKMPDNYLFYSLRAAIFRFQKNNTAADADDAKAKALSSK